MPRLDRLPEVNRSNLLTFPAQVNDTAPFVALPKLLSACRRAIVTTAGLHRRGDRPFGPGGANVSRDRSDTPAADIIRSHTSTGFDRAPIMRDVSISFPIERARELVARGELAGLGPSCYSFMGALRGTARIEGETGPETARRPREEGAAVALIACFGGRDTRRTREEGIR